MSIDWDKVDKEIDAAIEEAAAKTDQKLASKMSSITRLTEEEVMELFPEPTDVKKLKDLLKVVKSAEDKNAKINKIVQNIEGFAGVIVTLLGKVA